uniref:Uncharacterized protein n=1 Tax=viral metagenome TaxID=1070528 RepID=A0A6M3XN09_9ZZZZ
MINKSMFDNEIGNIVLTKVCSVKPDGDSNESKQITVNMDYSGLTLYDVFVKALSSDVIKWQAAARKRFDSLDKVENVKAKSPGMRPQIDPATALANEAIAAGIDMKDKTALANFIIAKLSK